MADRDRPCRSFELSAFSTVRDASRCRAGAGHATAGLKKDGPEDRSVPHEVLGDRAPGAAVEIDTADTTDEGGEYKK
ncbi:hypothetical protein [Micromonospora auratinigra]|uniref:hypothetical protein n=1 Tax=Micromonospora auratinigra TaxID=261654 RepID=UPI00142FF9AD|nr:hypothetical protein [Micromonospora auratinigra]